MKGALITFTLRRGSRLCWIVFNTVGTWEPPKLGNIGFSKTDVKGVSGSHGTAGFFSAARASDE